MISHRNRCILIHIPKTAGTSIQGHLAPDGPPRQDHRSITNLQDALLPYQAADLFSSRWPRYLFQELSRRLEGLPKLTRPQFDDYFKFTFVRNPWARAYSWYKGVMRDQRYWKKHGITGELTLHQFLVRHGDSWGLRPQLWWITDRRGDIAVDFVGRFESLEQDFGKVCDHLNIDNGDLPRHLVANNPPYTDEYDDRSRALVQERYAAEIDLFGYQFGG